MPATLLCYSPLTQSERKDVIKKIWMLFRTEGVHDDIREFAAMTEALLAEYHIFFEKAGKFNEAELAPYNDDVREWFYETVNTLSMADNFRDFYTVAQAAFDFSRSYNPFR